MPFPSHLTDDDLVAEMIRLAQGERENMAALIAHLVEFDERRLYLGAGFGSLFLYCVEVLRLSEHEAYNRMEAARAARAFPLVLELLRDGAVNLTTVRLLAPHLTAENHEALLTSASGRRKREVELPLAQHFPRPDVPSSVRKVAAPPAQGAIAVPPAAITGAISETLAPGGTLPERSASARSCVDDGHAIAGSASQQLAPSLPPARDRREVVRPLAEDRYEVRFTASAETCRMLRQAKDLLRHAIPNGDTGQIVERALAALLEELARKKLAATTKPRAARGGRGRGRHIPAQVKRVVWLRDEGRCAFVGKGNRRCREEGFLEFHHVQPYAVGGPATPENIQMRCRAHNAYEAELFYGRGEVAPAGSDDGMPNSFRNESRQTPRIGSGRSARA